MSDTPRTDAHNWNEGHYDDPLHSLLDFAKQLERELNAANSEVDRLRKANLQLREGAEEQKQRIKRLYDGVLKNNQEIEQTCGKALGYSWFKDDQKNFPGATEKDGVCVGEHVAETIVSELAKRHTEVLARIKRLEEAGDYLCAAAAFMGWHDKIEDWNKAKEAKP